MSESIKDMVDRGLAIREELKKLKLELKGIASKLERYGLNGQHEELKDSDREGRRWLARGSSLIVPVVFTADKIIGSFKANSPAHTRILAASDSRLRDFYHSVTTFENLFDDGKKFRARADELLGKEQGPRFITACLSTDKHGIPESDVKILWDDAEPIPTQKEAA